MRTFDGFKVVFTSFTGAAHPSKRYLSRRAMKSQCSNNRFCRDEKEYLPVKSWKLRQAARGEFDKMHRPIAIPMEDDIIHTQEHPYCDDPACPCHTQAHERAANVPHQPARRKARRKSGAARGKKKAAARR